MTQTSRVLRLLGLLQSRPTWTGPELAERLDVTTRTVRRDVDRLRALGYPVRAGQGVGGGYQLGLGGGPAAAAARRRGGRGGGGVAAAGRRRHGGRARRAGDAHPGQARPGAAGPAAGERRGGVARPPSPWAAATSSSRAPWWRCSPGPRAACHEVRFDYAAASGEESSRRAEPYRLVATTSRWYLLAWDLDRADWRSFRLDRMSEVRESTFTFRPREAPDAAEHVREALARGPQGVEVVLDIDAPLDVVADAVPAGFGDAVGPGRPLRDALLGVGRARGGGAAGLAALGVPHRLARRLADEVAALADRLTRAAD